MRAIAAVACLAVLSVTPAAAQPEQSPSLSQTVPELALVPAPPAATGLLAKLSDKVIREAVRDTLAEPIDNPRRHEADTLRGNSYTEFAQQFREARVPDCLHGDALKRQPPRIGPIGFSYLYAVPFVVLAKLRGKCN
jgi:hypothetical protein